MAAELTSNDSLSRWRASNSMLHHVVRLGTQRIHVTGDASSLSPLEQALRDRNPGKPFYVEDQEPSPELL